MQFVVGQVWRTHGGFDATVTNIFDSHRFPVHVTVCISNSLSIGATSQTYSVSMTGSYTDSGPNNRDLIELISNVATKDANGATEVESYTVEEIAAAYSQEFVERLRLNRLKS